MLNGEYYNSRDPELLALYHRARKLINRYNDLDSEDLDERRLILDDMLGHCAEGVWIEAPFYCDYGANISIGQDTFINMNCFLLDNGKITIGKNVLIGPSVQIYTASHPLRASERVISIKERKKGMATYKTKTSPVTIGDNVWIGGNVSILPGITIGNNSVIGAGSIVNHSIPRDVLALGNPCKVVKLL